MGAQQSLTPADDTVLVVDDDQFQREALDNLFRSVGLRVVTFASATDVLTTPLPSSACCIVLDVRLPQLSGLELQDALAKANIRVPIIFVTGHGDISMSVRAMKAGAMDFLTKPFRDQDMLDAVCRALDHDRAHRQREKIITNLQERFNALSAREKEVTELVLAGQMNKQIAEQLGIAEITVRVHRRHILEKMDAKSVAELVLLMGSLRIEDTKARLSA